MNDTNDLLTMARARFDHAVARRLLREKYEAKMLFACNGGMFRATPEMIVFLSLYGNQRLVVKDLYDNPIEVNAQELCDIMRSRWDEQMNAWLCEYEQQRSER